MVLSLAEVSLSPLAVEKAQRMLEPNLRPRLQGQAGQVLSGWEALVPRLS